MATDHGYMGARGDDEEDGVDETGNESPPPHLMAEETRTLGGLGESVESPKQPSMDVLDAVEYDYEEIPGCPVFLPRKLELKEVIELLFHPSQIPPERVCERVPPFCPGLGKFTFVIDTNPVGGAPIESRDLAMDDYSWRKPSGAATFFREDSNADGDFVKLGDRVTPNEDWDLKILCKRYQHKTFAHKFRKWIFELKTNDAKPELSLETCFAIIGYECQVEPHTVERRTRRSNAGRPPGTNRVSSLDNSHSAARRSNAVTFGSRVSEIDSAALMEGSLDLDDSSNFIPTRSGQKRGFEGGLPPAKKARMMSKETEQLYKEKLILEIEQISAETHRAEVERQKLEMEKNKIALEMEVLAMKRELLRGRDGDDGKQFSLSSFDL